MKIFLNCDFLGFMWFIWFLQEKSTTPTPPVQEGSFLSPNAQRRREKGYETQARFEPPAKSWLPARVKAFSIADLRISDESRKVARCVFVKALFERSASSALTWLFWFFLCQDKKNTEGRNEKLNELSIVITVAMKKRYGFRLKKSAGSVRVGSLDKLGMTQ